jgi:hypothetical protein
MDVGREPPRDRTSSCSSDAPRSVMTDFFRFTVHARAPVIVFVVAFVAFGLAQPMMIGFGVVDLLGAIWTALALRSE